MIVGQTIENGRYYTTWEDQGTGRKFTYMTFTDPTTEQLENLAQMSLDMESVSTLPSLGEEFREHEYVLYDFLVYIRNNPTTTLAQLNTYLSKLLWFESAALQYMIFKVCTKYAASEGLVLTDYTNNQIWTKFRDFVVNASKRRLAHIFFNQINRFD